VGALRIAHDIVPDPRGIVAVVCRRRAQAYKRARRSKLAKRTGRRLSLRL